MTQQLGGRLGELFTVGRCSWLRWNSTICDRRCGRFCQRMNRWANKATVHNQASRPSPDRLALLSQPPLRFRFSMRSGSFRNHCAFLFGARSAMRKWTAAASANMQALVGTTQGNTHLERLLSEGRHGALFEAADSTGPSLFCKVLRLIRPSASRCRPH